MLNTYTNLSEFKDRMEENALHHNEKILELESKGCFDFFWNEVNKDINSPGYGLIRDRVPHDSYIASIASVGFGLTAIIIGVERAWISYEEGFERIAGTLNSLINNAQHINGFFYHFVDIRTGKRAWQSEVSNIDTAIAICGALSAGEYFGGIIKDKAEELYERVNWEWYRDKNRNQFYMGYSPEKGFEGWWDFYAEQMMMYFLGAASPTYPVNSEMFYDFTRHESSYGNSPSFINSWFGSIFTYQFSHAFFDFRNTKDREGVDWYENSVAATINNRNYCIDYSVKYKTFNENSWGLTACDGPHGYSGRYGAAPSGSIPRGRHNLEHRNDGTVTPCGAAGSIVFTPHEVIDSMNYYYDNFPRLWGKYGFRDAYNLDVTPAWFGEDYIGIDKGITLLMIENYRTGFVWNLFMKNKYARLGMELCGVNKPDVDEEKESTEVIVA